ncbi:MAG: hypothetical protein JW725_00610, partial [Candidatus Babeliaceae bacterium]|nr:hypothetical protein [Candidatus Babeliaceae bacterium]
ITEAMDVIYSAWRLAKHKNSPIIDDRVFYRADKFKKEYFSQAPLSDDSIYNSLLIPIHDGTPAIGVVLERSELMMGSRLSFGGRLIMSAAMRTMKANKIPYHTIDLRSLNSPNALSPRQTPILVS